MRREWGKGEGREGCTGDLVREDGGEDFELLILFLFAHAIPP